LVPQPVCQPDTLYLEFFIDARPFPELDNERLGNGQFAEQPHVGPEAVRQHIGIKAVILRPRDREAIAEAVELLGVNGIDVDAALEQCFDDRAMRCLDGGMHLTGLAAARLQKPGDHIAESNATMSKLTLPDLLASVIAERDDMLLRSPVNTDEPFSFFVHHVSF